MVSVTAHLVGRQVRAMVEAFLAGEREEAARLHRSLLPLTDAMFLVGNPVPVKYALNQVGFRVGPPRLPLVEPDDAIKAKINAELERVQIDLPLPV